MQHAGSNIKPGRVASPPNLQRRSVAPYTNTFNSLGFASPSYLGVRQEPTKSSQVSGLTSNSVYGQSQYLRRVQNVVYGQPPSYGIVRNRVYGLARPSIRYTAYKDCRSRPNKLHTMGQTLSEPVTVKESAFCQNSKFKVGSSCMQGWRINMEDSHTHVLSLPDDPGTSFFGVFDGHGGAKVAQYAGKHLHKFIIHRPEYKMGDYVTAMKMGYLDIDNAMLAEDSLKNDISGSTAVSILIRDNKLYCANAGDSRAIASINGMVEVLSFDHKPSNDSEMSRIMSAGGWVEFNRVNGNLALSRALGDFQFKRNDQKCPQEQIVTAFPDVEYREITEDWEFVVLACDGIWDVLTNEDVVGFVRHRLRLGLDPEDICEQLMSRCLAPDCQMGGLGCDNMTVVIVCFLHDKPFEQFVLRCNERQLM